MFLSGDLLALVLGLETLHSHVLDEREESVIGGFAIGLLIIDPFPKLKVLIIRFGQHHLILDPLLQLTHLLIKVPLHKLPRHLRNQYPLITKLLLPIEPRHLLQC